MGKMKYSAFLLLISKLELDKICLFIFMLLVIQGVFSESNLGAEFKAPNWGVKIPPNHFKFRMRFRL